MPNDTSDLEYRIRLLEAAVEILKAQIQTLIPDGVTRAY